MKKEAGGSKQACQSSLCRFGLRNRSFNSINSVRLSMSPQFYWCLPSRGISLLHVQRIKIFPHLAAAFWCWENWFWQITEFHPTDCLGRRQDQPCLQVIFLKAPRSHSSSKPWLQKVRSALSLSAEARMVALDHTSQPTPHPVLPSIQNSWSLMLLIYQTLNCSAHLENSFSLTISIIPDLHLRSPLGVLFQSLLWTPPLCNLWKRWCINIYL